MEQKYVLYLLGFTVALRDRRNGEQSEGFIVAPFPGEHPEDTEDAHEAIRVFYSSLGYDVKEIAYKGSKVKEIKLLEAYNAAPTTEEYAQ